MGHERGHRRILRIVAVALALAAVGAFGPAHGLPGQAEQGLVQAQIPPRDAPQITALIQATTSSIAVVWLPADNTDVHWLYAVKADGTGGRFELAVPDPPQGASGQGGVTSVSHVTTVSGLDAGTQYWFAVLGVRAPSDSSPSAWFRWSNWGRGTTLTVPTVSLGPSVAVAEGATATLTVTASPAPQAPLTVNYAIGADADPATVDGDSSDYRGTATGSITMASGDTEGSIAVAITDDNDIDDGAREILVVTISLPEGSSYQLGERSSATVTITEGVCDRTAAVRTAILGELTGTSACAEVTDADLSGLTGTLDLSRESLTAVQARDFRGLTGLQVLRLNHNSLASLPAEVFDGLASLQELYLNNNALTVLPADAFDGLTSLATLSLSNNSLAALEADVFDGLTSLATLRLNNNSSLAALPADVFDGLTSLTTLRLNNDALAALPDGLFDGLSGLHGLYLANNPGSPFTFTAAVAQTTATAVKVAVAQAAPFDVTVTLAIHGGALSDSSVTIPAGRSESAAVTVTPSGDAPVTVSVTAASFPASGVQTGGVTVTYNGIQTGLSAANQAPTADAGLDQTVQTGATVTLDASGSSDADTGDTLSYHWEQTAGATVTLSSATAASPTFTAPSSADALTFAVTAIDGRGGSDRDTVDITVSGNAPPTFTSGATFSVAENTTAVGTVIASDPDAGDSITGYTLSGTDAGLFAITSAGVLTFSTAPDFEDPQGGASDDANSYELTVTATGGTGDRALTAAQDLTVTVTDANEPPAFTSGATFSVAENTTAVGTVIASDADDGITGYTLSGTDAGLFSITSAGVLTFQSAPDFEDPQGGASDDSNSYELTVTATGGAGDRALTGTQDLTVTVTNVNEVPGLPAAPTFGTITSTSLVVNWEAPANTGPAITNYDVQYRETGTTSWSSWSHSGTGRTTTITDLAANTQYQVQVRAQNADGESAWSETSTVTTAADLMPSFGSSTISDKSFSEDEAITAFTLPEATSGNTPLTYRVSSLPAGLSFTASSRQISGTPTTAGNTVVTYTVTDADGDTDTLDFTITVTAAGAPGTPGTPTLTGTPTYTSIELTWTAASAGDSHILRYDVQYRESGAATWITAGGSDANLTERVHGLTPSTTYEFRVSAVNSQGRGPWSGIRTTTTRTPKVPGTPGTPTLTGTPASTSIELTWTAASAGDSHILRYDVQYRESGATTWTTAGGSDANLTERVHGLTPSTTYEFRLSAVNSQGRGPWSGIRTATTAAS